MLFYWGGSELALHGRDLFLPAPDDWRGMGHKTLACFEYVLSHREFDLVYRTTCAAYVDLPNLVAWSREHARPTDFYAGPGGGTQPGKPPPSYVPGCGLFLSRDLVEWMVRHRSEWDHAYHDDVAIGLLLGKRGTYAGATPRVTLTNLWEPREIDTSQYHFRCKTDSSWRRGDIDLLRKVDDAFARERGELHVPWYTPARRLKLSVRRTQATLRRGERAGSRSGARARGACSPASPAARHEGRGRRLRPGRGRSGVPERTRPGGALPLRLRRPRAEGERGGRERLVVLQGGLPRVLLPSGRTEGSLRPLLARQRPHRSTDASRDGSGRRGSSRGSRPTPASGTRSCLHSRSGSRIRCGRAATSRLCARLPRHLSPRRGSSTRASTTGRIASSASTASWRPGSRRSGRGRFPSTSAGCAPPTSRSRRAGNGVDLHRMWEALYVGTIPVGDAEPRHRAASGSAAGRARRLVRASGPSTSRPTCTRRCGATGTRRRSGSSATWSASAPESTRSGRGAEPAAGERPPARDHASRTRD